MKTPFNAETSSHFDMDGLRRLDFLESDDGWVIAFDLRAFKSGFPMNETNSIRVFKAAAVLPEAKELLISAPLLFKSLLAAHMGLGEVLNASEQLQNYLKKKNASDPNVNFIVKQVSDILNMIVSAVNIPVVGRMESLKIANAPLDTFRKPD